LIIKQTNKQTNKERKKEKGKRKPKGKERGGGAEVRLLHRSPLDRREITGSQSRFE